MECYFIDKDTLNEGISRCIDKAKRLLDDSLILLNNGSETVHALGLYLFAVEEYGKALLLKESTLDKNGLYSVSVNIFRGRDAHKIKFNKAVEHLPDACKKLRIGLRIRVPSPDNKTISFREEKLSIGAWLTGFFQTGSEYLVDVLNRNESFYVDWYAKYGQWNWEPSVMKEELVEAINRFKEHLTSL